MLYRSEEGDSEMKEMRVKSLLGFAGKVRGGDGVW